jgi:hypothetical protein
VHGHVIEVQIGLGRPSGLDLGHSLRLE